MTLPGPDDDVPEIFRSLDGRLDLAEALAKLADAKDAGTVRHWLIVWVENDADPAEPRLHHTHFEDEIVGLGLAKYAEQSIERSWEGDDDDL